MCRSVFRIAYPGKKYLISVIFLSKGKKIKSRSFILIYGCISPYSTDCIVK